MKAQRAPKSPEKEKTHEVLQVAQKTRDRPMPKKQGSWWVMGKSANAPTPTNDSSEQLVVAHSKALPPIPKGVISEPTPATATALTPETGEPIPNQNVSFAWLQSLT